MRWLACVLFLAGCLRARATVVHPTDVDRTNVGGGGSPGAITRGGPQMPQAPDASTTLGSLELGALFAFDSAPDAPRVHIAPGVRIFESAEKRSVLGGVAVGADFNRRGGAGFALEGSVHAGGGNNDPGTIQVALDVFGGITIHSNRASSSIAVGPSIGLLGMPGGHSAVMFGLGLRLTSSRN